MAVHVWWVCTKEYVTIITLFFFMDTICFSSILWILYDLSLCISFIIYNIYYQAKILISFFSVLFKGKRICQYIYIYIYILGLFNSYNRKGKILDPRDVMNIDEPTSRITKNLDKNSLIEWVGTQYTSKRTSSSYYYIIYVVTKPIGRNRFPKTWFYYIFNSKKTREVETKPTSEITWHLQNINIA